MVPDVPVVAKPGVRFGVPGSGSVPLTATPCETVPVAPFESVTVNVTVYEPSAEYVCDAVEPLPAGEPSPHAHDHDAMGPSASVEQEPLTDVVSTLSLCVKHAVGAVLEPDGVADPSFENGPEPMEFTARTL